MRLALVFGWFVPCSVVPASRRQVCKYGNGFLGELITPYGDRMVHESRALV